MSMSMNFFEWQKHVQPSNQTFDEAPPQLMQSPISSAPAHQARPKPIQQIRNASTPDLLSQDEGATHLRTLSSSQAGGSNTQGATFFPLQIASYQNKKQEQQPPRVQKQKHSPAKPGKNQNQQRRILMDQSQNMTTTTVSPRQQTRDPMYIHQLQDADILILQAASPQKLVLSDLPQHNNKPTAHESLYQQEKLKFQAQTHLNSDKKSESVANTLQPPVKQKSLDIKPMDYINNRNVNRSPSLSNQGPEQTRTQTTRFNKTLSHIAKEVKTSDEVVNQQNLLYQATSCQKIAADADKGRPHSNEVLSHHSVTPGTSRKKSVMHHTTKAAVQRLYPSESRRLMHEQRDQQKSALLNRSATLKPQEIGNKLNQTVKVGVSNNRLSEVATTLLAPYMQHSMVNYTVQRSIGQHALPGRVIKHQKSFTQKVTQQAGAMGAPFQPHQELHQVLNTIKEQIVQQQKTIVATQLLPQQSVLPGIAEKPEVTPTHKFQVVQGNNGRLIRNVLIETRSHLWYETAASIDSGTQYKGGQAFQQPISHFHLRWAPTSRGINFERMSQNLFAQMVNHYEGHQEISTKNKLFKNVTIWSDEQQELVFKNMLPLTFCIKLPILANGEVDKTSLSHEMKPFKQAYKLLQSYKDDILKDHSKTCVVIGDDSNPREFRQKSNQPLVMPLCHFEGKNVWILKPTGLNRGKGIHVVDKIKDVKRIIKQTCIENYQGKVQPSQQLAAQAANMKSHKFPKTLDSQAAQKLQKPVQEMKTFVIQKYIESPFLMNRRKFDIRVWVLVTQDLDVYFFREGYLRMSCADYSNDKLQDEYVHLTNNAIQRNCPNYGQQEDGNQLSFADLRSYLKKEYPDDVDFDRDIMPKMKYQAMVTMLSVSKKLNPYRRKHCFELFGLDFMLDSDLNCVLIEANTNPCLEESSRLLELILPRMVDDMFKLTIDQVFVRQPTPPQSASTQTQSSKQNQNLMTSVLKQRQQQQLVDPNIIANRPSPYRVPGYKDNFNIWEKLCNLKQPVAPKKSDFYHLRPQAEQSYMIHLMHASKLRLIKTALVEQHIKIGVRCASASRLSILSTERNPKTPKGVRGRSILETQKASSGPPAAEQPVTVEILKTENEDVKDSSSEEEATGAN